MCILTLYFDCNMHFLLLSFFYDVNDCIVSYKICMYVKFQINKTQ